MTTITAEPAVDAKRAEKFAETMLEVFNHGATTLLLSVGHQTGLFDTLAKLPPSTSEQIAAAAKLNERYVREWLRGVLCGGIVEYDPARKTWFLPREHAQSLTRAAGSDNLAFFTQYITLAAGVEPGIVDCFRNGGGLGYDAFPSFQKIQGEESRQTYEATLISRTIPSFPQVEAKLRNGIDVLDVGTGTGVAPILLAEAFPKSNFTAYDISEEGIALARAEARRRGLKNIRFEIRDAASFDDTESFDLITAFDAIHDQVAPRKVLANIYRALRKGGQFLMVDIAASSNPEENVDHPLGPVIHVLSVFHCMTVSLAGGGEGLGTAWGEQKARELLAEAGFRKVDLNRVEGDIFNYYYLTEKS